MQNRLTVAALIYVVANFASAAVPFLLLPILTRVLSPADYGQIAIFITLIGIFAAFTGLSVHGAIAVRYFKISADELPDLVTTCLIIVGGATAAVFAISALLSPVLVKAAQLPAPWLLLAIPVSAAQIVCHVRLVLWQVTQKPIRFASFQISQMVVNLGLSLFLVLVIALGWQGRIIAQSVTFGCFAGLALILLWRAGMIVRPKAFRRHLRDILRFGVPLIPHVLGAMMIVGIDRLVIVSKLGMEEAGLYLAFAQIGAAIGLLADALNKAYSPWLMRQLSLPPDTGVPPRRIVTGSYALFAGMIALAFAVGFTGPWIAAILLGPEFRESVEVLIFIALGNAFGGCYLIVTNYVFYSARTEILAYITFSCGLIHLALTWVFVDLYGIIGAGYAFAISRALSFLATWLLANRAHPMPWLAWRRQR